MSTIPTTTVTELPDDAVIVDVREADEWAAGHAPNAIHIPLATCRPGSTSCPRPTTPSPIVCRMGGRSARAVQWLVHQGFDVANVEGGMLAWQRAGKQLAGPAEPSII